MAKKVILLGLDGAVPYQFIERARRGELTNIARLIKDGFFAPALPLPSGVTPVNWLSIATGAYPGTHGVSEFSVHEPGTPLTEHHGAFSSDVSRAEFIWDALARTGLKSATISYPCHIPRTNNLQFAIGNNGSPGDGMALYEVSSSQCVATQNTIPDTENTPVFKKYEPLIVDWGGAEFDFPIVPDGERFRARLGSEARLEIRRASGEFLCELVPKEWSEWLRIRLEREVNFRFYLTSLDPEERKLILFISPIYDAGGFSDPPEVADQLARRIGPYSETLSVSKCSIGWYDPSAFIDECREQLLWQAQASLELVNSMGVSLVLTKCHLFDKFYHTFFHKIDSRSPHHNPSEREEWEAHHSSLHKAVDDAVGVVLDSMDSETVLMIASDHGLVPASHHLWLNNFLAKNGFISVEFDRDGNPRIDWSRTKAYCAPFSQIWVNLKGRDPDGCVEPGEQYERLRDEIIHLLRSWKNQETGEYVIDEVFRVEDGAFYGLWGEKDGDIRFFTRPGYSVFRTTGLSSQMELVTVASGYYKGDHGSSHPTRRFGLGSETALFAMCGAGVKPFGVSNRPIKLVDITPTICALLDVQTPVDCEGAVIRRALLSP